MITGCFTVLGNAEMELTAIMYHCVSLITVAEKRF